MASEKNPNTHINTAFVAISRRAESVDRETLVRTFVDIGPLFAVLSTNDHQIVYGRRGTGKTHALLYVAEQSKKKGDISIYIDLRFTGSSGGIYGDSEVPIPQRATRLLLDVLASIHDGLLDYAIESHQDLSRLAPVLDKLAAASSELEVVGETLREIKDSTSHERETSSTAAVSIQKQPMASLGGKEAKRSVTGTESHCSERGVSRYRVHFGSVSTALRDIVAIIKPARLLIVLDEWGTLPSDLQPYLADLVRRAIFPVQGISVKIAAIEQRSSFKLGTGPEYTGIEIGADASADVDLDDYMVFDNNEERALEFFKELIYRHYESEESNEKPAFSNADKLLQAAFTQANAFEDFVRSAEGVPRDAFNVLSLAAQRGMNDKISIPTVRIAARTWYQRDKEGAIRANRDALELLHWIIDEVIAHRKARAFLLEANARHPVIDALFDARLLHVIKKGLSGQEEAGVRYDAYKLDYGCYVDLLATKSTPTSTFGISDSVLLGDDSGAAVEVPNDDYRAIRRAILKLRDFESRIMQPQLLALEVAKFQQ